MGGERAVRVPSRKEVLPGPAVSATASPSSTSLRPVAPRPVVGRLRVRGLACSPGNWTP